MAQIELTVLTPERVLLAVGNAQKVRLRLADGAWLSVYPGHAPLVAEVQAGPVQYETELESGELTVEGGILRIHAAEVVLLTSGLLRRPDPAESPGDERFDRLSRDLMHALSALRHDSPAEDGAD